MPTCPQCGGKMYKDDDSKSVPGFGSGEMWRCRECGAMKEK